MSILKFFRVTPRYLERNEREREERDAIIRFPVESNEAYTRNGIHRGKPAQKGDTGIITYEKSNTGNTRITLAV